MKNAEEVVIATDYDLEGEVIGGLLIELNFEQLLEQVKRMKFSSLTKSELIDAFNKLLSNINFGLYNSGKARHIIDWLFGINVSRALTLSLKNATGYYNTLSIGRVQGPTLRFVVEREIEIKKFVPIPFWEIKATFVLEKNTPIEGTYDRNPIKKFLTAKQIYASIEHSKHAKVANIEKRTFKQKPPVPFDLGTLQSEAYRYFKFSPSMTLSIAEQLYLKAYISYPRTSSQKLPPSINYREILQNISKMKKYKHLAKKLLEKDELVPNEGKKSDPAHPAIYPTGLYEGALTPTQAKLYDLIVKRFFAVFGEPSVKESVKIGLSVGEHLFSINGKRIVEPNWLTFYEPYGAQDEILLPAMEMGETIEIEKVSLIEKYTRPPARYNARSLLKKMESEGIGTKATRAGVIDTLYSRQYVEGEQMKATDLGFAVINVLMEYCPEIIDVTMTRNLELDLDQVAELKKEMNDLLIEKLLFLDEILLNFKKKEKAVGNDLNEMLTSVMKKSRILGSCPVCKTGELIVLRSRSSGKRFVGCTTYFENPEKCTTSFPLPQYGIIRALDKTCPHDAFPIIEIKTRGRPWKMCINPQCPSKKDWNKKSEKNNKEVKQDE